MSSDAFQSRVTQWMLACFGKDISLDAKERNHRFFEESVELTQSTGMTASEAHQLVDYVHGRPVGEKFQETGGVMVTLSALCSAQDIDMQQAGETELNRVWGMVEVIRAKQAAKPAHSPLPEHGKAHDFATLLEKNRRMEMVLKWYASGQHLQNLCKDWETPSGEPDNWLAAPDGPMVENGGMARVVLDHLNIPQDAAAPYPQSSEQRADAMLSLLEEVSANYTRDDDLPDTLLPRIELAVRLYRPTQARTTYRWLPIRPIDEYVSTQPIYA